jgi:hypothetical protein
MGYSNLFHKSYIKKSWLTAKFGYLPKLHGGPGVNSGANNPDHNLEILEVFGIGRAAANNTEMK